IVSLCALLSSRNVNYFEKISNSPEESSINFESSNKLTNNPDVPISNVNKEHDLTNEDWTMEMVIDANGNPKKYLNSYDYAGYLKILREQHNIMLYDIIDRADLAVANTSVYSVTLKPQLAPSNDPHDY
ncbi:18231_t:CDS:1, partial [Dentiscutata erythropus]